MTTFTYSDKLLRIYTNRNRSVFKYVGETLYKNITGKYGIIYDDFDCNQKIISNWKQYNLTTIFIICPRRKTIKIDDKIMFHKMMSSSKFTPESYLDKSKITDKNALYFVKSTGGTGGNGVNIYNFDTLQSINTKNCVIHKNIDNPDLYDNKRYKIRQLVFIHNKCVYLHKDSFFTASSIDYNNNTMNLKETHIFNQIPNRIFELSLKLEDFSKIFENITAAIIDFKKYYSTLINNIGETEYAILGFDLIVDSNKNIQIIEINHRSNYAHPKNVNTQCDIGGIRDLFYLLINKCIDNTRLIKI